MGTRFIFYWACSISLSKQWVFSIMDELHKEKLNITSNLRNINLKKKKKKKIKFKKNVEYKMNFKSVKKFWDKANWKRRKKCFIYLSSWWNEEGWVHIPDELLIWNPLIIITLVLGSYFMFVNGLQRVCKIKV